MDVWCIGLRRHSREIAGQVYARPLFLQNGFFGFVGILGYGFGAWYSGICGLEGQGTLGLSHHFAVDRFLTLVVGLLMAIWPWRRLVDFLAVVERRLIPARVRSEWARLRGQRLASVWAPACQDSPHVGNAGSGLSA